MRILHLSDPQFGAHHRFTEGRLATAIREDLGEPVDLIVVTGDLAEWSKPAEYRAVGVFLDSLRGELPRERVLFVPGNHDVSFTAHKRYVMECEERDEAPAAPFWPKWQYFKAFLDEWYGADNAGFTPAQPWSWWELPELDLVVAGFNSTLPETDTIHDWAIGEEQARFFAARLGATEARYRVGLVHHDVFHGRDAATRERARLKDLALTLLLHGHTHIQTTEHLRDTPVLGVGSLGIEKEWREEDVANQYQLLTVDGDRLARVVRRYHGPSGRFVAEDVVAEADRAFRLPADRGVGGVARGRFVDRVAEALQLRESDAVVTVVDEHAVQVRRGAHRQLIGAAEQATGEAVAAYLRAFAGYRADDPTLAPTFVHRGEAGERDGVRISSLSEVQGLIDFTALRRWQRERIAEDHRYPEERYVPQRIRLGTPHPAEADDPKSALDLVHDLVTEPGEHPRLALVLAPFGTGKTFLVRQLARRLEREWTEGGRVPLWIELRHLEKASSFEALLAAHLSRAGQKRIDHDQLDYMRREGRVVLLFDGFDELVLRVSYDRATEHLETLAAAAEGRARVVVTSRTEHFLRTRDAAGALLRRLSNVDGLRVLHVQEFSATEAEAYLGLRLGSAGRQRFERLRAIPNLIDLARTPRMLEMLAELEDADLDAAERQVGPMNAARLYDTVIERWLRREEERRSPRGGLPPLGWQAARAAASKLAERAWQRSAEEVEQEDLRNVASGLPLRGYSLEEAAHELGSGTLLVRDEEARFRFAHRSVLEFLVAESCAVALRAGEGPPLLDCGEASGVLVRFLGELAGDSLDDWARAAMRPGGPEGRRRNALAVAAARGLRVALDLRGQDLRGRDDLRQLDLSGADLSGADLSGLDLTGVDLRGARLEGTKLNDTRLLAANLEGATGTPAEVLGASFLRARGWDDRATVRPEAMFARFTGPLAWGPDGWLAAAAGAAVWVLGPDRRWRGRAEAEGVVSALAFSNRGVLAVALEAGPVGLMDVSRGGETVGLPFGGDGVVVSMDFDAEGRALCVGYEGGGVVMVGMAGAAGTPARSETGFAGQLLAVRFGVGGRCIVALTRAGILRAWTLDPACPDSSDQLPTHELTAADIADDRSIAVTSRAGGFSEVWSHGLSGVRDGSATEWDWALADALRPDRPTGRPGIVVGMRLSSMPRHLATVDDGGLLVVRQLESTGWLETGPGFCWNGLVADEQALWAFTRFGRIDRWSTEGGGRVPEYFGLASVTSAAAVGRYVAIVDGGEVYVFEIDTKRVVLTSSVGYAAGAALPAPDGKSVLVRGLDGVWLLGGERGGSAQSPLPVGVRARVWSYHPDSQSITFGDVDGHIERWTLTNPPERTATIEIGGEITTLEHAPTGGLVAAGTEGGHVTVWSWDDDRRASWDAGGADAARRIAFSPDGAILATGAADGTVRLWSSADGTLLHTLRSNQGEVAALAFTPDGRTLYTAGDDGRVLRWNVATGTFEGWMAAGPDGSVCVAPDGSHRVQGDVKGWFWISHGLHRYEVGELDRWLPGLRIQDGEPFPWGRTALPDSEARAPGGP